METLAFRALVGDDIVGIVADRCILQIGVQGGTVKQCEGTLHRRAIGKGPLDATLIDRVVGTFRFTSAAVDTFFSDLDGHEFEFFGVE
jgi:hypothetical protein